MKLAEQASRFVLVGAIGFLIDGGIMTFLHSVFDIGLLQARLVSFSVAVTVTWYLNRQHTFADSKDARAMDQWGRYAIVNTVGALLNLGIFLWLVYRFTFFADWPIVPLAIAATVALVFNFFASRRLAFRTGQP